MEQNETSDHLSFDVDPRFLVQNFCNQIVRIAIWNATVKINLAKIRPAKICLAKIRPAKISPAKIRPAKIRPAKIRPAKIRPAKISLAKIRPAKISPSKILPAKIRPSKIRPAKIRPAKIVKFFNATIKEIYTHRITPILPKDSVANPFFQIR